MRFTITTRIAALLVASGCSAFVVSEDQPDGLYSVHVNGKRSEHILLREYNETETSDFDLKTISNRDPLPQVEAACAINVCGNEIGKSGIYVKYGSAIAFACSWGGPQPCSSREYTDAMQILDKKCGNLAAGFVQMTDWKKIYGRTVVGEETCLDYWN
ncbi:hypothetical protein DL768_002960 [Monosporascus sp. mg162]|nr:hypothetical protein DL768_002960 [Monosporascus sp. mg162]